MKITILKCGQMVDNKVLTKKDLLELENHFKGKEILGMLQKYAVSGAFDANRISHTNKKIRYNKITNGLEVDVEFLTGWPFGEHLAAVYNKSPKQITWLPLCRIDGDNLKLIRVDATIEREKNV